MSVSGEICSKVARVLAESLNVDADHPALTTESLIRTPLAAPWRTLWFWIAGFVAFSAADLFLTWVLVGTGRAYEANPIAAAVLNVHGWLGLAIFRAACLSLVLLLVISINLFDAIAARRVLRLSCAGMAVLIVYSLMLVKFSSTGS